MLCDSWSDLHPAYLSFQSPLLVHIITTATVSYRHGEILVPTHVTRIEPAVCTHWVMDGWSGLTIDLPRH